MPFPELGPWGPGGRGGGCRGEGGAEHQAQMAQMNMVWESSERQWELRCLLKPEWRPVLNAADPEGAAAA